MKNDAPFQIKKSARGFAYGGREVLRLALDLPQGACRAAAHFERIGALWEAFVAETLFPRAAEEWMACVRAGRAFAFCPHKAVGRLTAKPHGRGLKISFSAILTVGNELRYSRSLVTFWSADGALQKKRVPRVKKKKK